MTPAMRAAKAAGVAVKAHEYRHDPGNTSYGHEAAEALGLDPERVFKTLLVTLNGDQRRLAVAVVPVTPGVHHYGFRVDGEWYVPEGHSGNVPDEWGRMNATLVVADEERGGGP